MDPPSVSPCVTWRHAHQRVGELGGGDGWSREDFRGWLGGIDEREGGREEGRKMAGGGDAGEDRRVKAKQECDGDKGEMKAGGGRDYTGGKARSWEQRELRKGRD